MTHEEYLTDFREISLLYQSRRDSRACDAQCREMQLTDEFNALGDPLCVAFNDKIAELEAKHQKRCEEHQKRCEEHQRRCEQHQRRCEQVRQQHLAVYDPIYYDFEARQTANTNKLHAANDAVYSDYQNALNALEVRRSAEAGK